MCLCVQQRKRQCPMEKLDYCIQCQGHSEGSKCTWMSVWMIFSEPQNILLPNLVWWCSILSQSVMQKEQKLFAIFKVKVTARAHMIKYDSFYIFRTADFLATIHGLMTRHHKPESLDWITAFKVKVTAKGQNVNFCSDDSFQPAKYFATRLGIKMHHHEPELFSRSRSLQRLIWSKYDSFYYTFWSAYPFATKHGHIVHFISQSAIWRDWITVIKVKVTAKFQNVSECMSRWHLLNCWTFYYQTWYDDASSWAKL